MSFLTGTKLNAEKDTSQPDEITFPAIYCKINDHLFNSSPLALAASTTIYTKEYLVVVTHPGLKKKDLCTLFTSAWHALTSLALRVYCKLLQKYFEDTRYSLLNLSPALETQKQLANTIIGLELST